MGFVVGLLAGIVATVIVEIIIRFVFAPSVSFYTSVYRRTYDDGSKGYFIKYANTGNRRLIDPEIQVAVYVPGLVSNHPDKKQVLFIETSAKDRLFIDTKKKLKNPINTKLLFEESDSISNNKLLPVEFIKRASEGKLRLEDFFELGENVYAIIRIVGSDEMSGVRKLFESPIYKINDIVDEK